MENKWMGTIITMIILVCGTYCTTFPYELEAVIHSSLYRLCMILIILIAKFFSPVLAIGLAIVLITFVRVYGEYLQKTININRSGLTEDEYKQYMSEYQEK